MFSLLTKTISFTMSHSCYILPIILGPPWAWVLWQANKSHGTRICHIYFKICGRTFWVPVPMLPAREPLTLQTTLATISFCSSSFPSSSSSSPSFLAASRKPKCCRYGLGPSCSSGSLPSHSSSSSLLALSLSVHLFPLLHYLLLLLRAMKLIYFSFASNAEHKIPKKKKNKKKPENFSFLRLLV